MTQKEYRELIVYRVNSINKDLGTDYAVNYIPHYGGWNMFLTSTNMNGALGFERRKSNAEMLNYVDGIFELLCHYDVKQK